MKQLASFLTLALVGGILLGGCQPKEIVEFVPPKKEKIDDVTFSAEAGISVAPSAFDFKKYGDDNAMIARLDPFALRAKERTYEQSQLAANLLQNNSWYQMEYSEPPPKDEEEGLVPTEAQPDRRLAGVLVGETVTALIDMNDGKGIQVIRPGSLLLDGEWLVVSIDEEKAILRRTNNKLRPSTVVVRLDANLAGGAAGGGAPGGDNQGGGTGNMGPGGPGGRPGPPGRGQEMGRDN